MHFLIQKKTQAVEVQELIDSGFLDSDNFDSWSDCSSSERSSFPSSVVELKDNYLENYAINQNVIGTELMVNAIIDDIIESMPDIHGTKNIENQNEKIMNKNIMKNDGETLSEEDQNEYSDEDYDGENEHKSSILWPILSCILSFAIIIHVFEGIHEKRHLNEYRSQNMTHLNEIMSKVGIHYVLMAELEMEHMQNFHNTDFLQFHEQFVWHSLFMLPPPNSKQINDEVIEEVVDEQNVMFKTVMHVDEDGTHHKTLFAIPIPGGYRFIIRRLNYDDERMEDGNNDNLQVKSYGCAITYPMLGSVSVVIRKHRFFTNCMISAASILTVLCAVNHLLSD